MLDKAGKINVIREVLSKFWIVTVVMQFLHLDKSSSKHPGGGVTSIYADTGCAISGVPFSSRR